MLPKDIIQWLNWWRIFSPFFLSMKLNKQSHWKKRHNSIENATHTEKKLTYSHNKLTVQIINVNTKHSKNPPSVNTERENNEKKKYNNNYRIIKMELIKI